MQLLCLLNERRFERRQDNLLTSVGLFAITYNMSFRDFITTKLIGPIMTNLICMPYYRPYFEDLSDIDSFDLSNARNLRIPVCNETSVSEPVIPFTVL